MRFARYAQIAFLVLPALVGVTVRGGCASAAGYRRLADDCARHGRYADAAKYYRQEAAVYSRLGDPNAAKVEEMKAERWSTEIQIFVDTPPDRKRLLGPYTGAKLEPVYGCYLGAFLDKDEKINRIVYGTPSSRSREEVFSELVGKQVSTSYMYRGYGVDFPISWAKGLCANGIIPHIAWEPNGGLSGVQYDGYLERFARSAGSCGGPVFIRFAGEMNGDWTRYHGDPDLYRKKFRLVHDVMERFAPNVAMIWCVNHIPEHNIDDYYPGDRYVDWVGVNFYSVIYHDNDVSRPGFDECPTSFLKFVYKKYAGTKPIAICEYGASHKAALDGVDRPGFAAEKLSKLFSALPRLYPRVKLIDIFDCDNLKHAMPSRQLNNYSVTDNEQVLAAFKRAVQSDYYLTHRYANSGEQQELPTHIRELADGSVLTGSARISAWVKTYEMCPKVVYTLDGKQLAATTNTGEYRVDLDTSRYAKGKHTLTVTVLDSKGRVAGRREVALRF